MTHKVPVQNVPPSFFVHYPFDEVTSLPPHDRRNEYPCNHTLVSDLCMEKRYVEEKQLLFAPMNTGSHPHSTDLLLPKAFAGESYEKMSDDDMGTQEAYHIVDADADEDERKSHR